MVSLTRPQDHMPCPARNNRGLQATASGLRSHLAPAIGGACGVALGKRRKPEDRLRSRSATSGLSAINAIGGACNSSGEPESSRTTHTCAVGRKVFVRRAVVRSVARPEPRRYRLGDCRRRIGARRSPHAEKLGTGRPRYLYGARGGVLLQAMGGARARRHLAESWKVAHGARCRTGESEWPIGSLDTEGLRHTALHTGPYRAIRPATKEDVLDT